MSTFHFKLITPSREVLAEDVSSVTVGTELGQITVLPHHAPLVATLVPGELVTKKGSVESNLAIAGGFIEVREGGEVVVLADAAEHSHEIDGQRAREAEARAKARMSEQQLSEEEYARLRTALQRSLARQMVFTRKSGRTPNPVGDVTNN